MKSNENSSTKPSSYKSSIFYLAAAGATALLATSALRSDTFYQLVKPVKNAARGGYMMDSLWGSTNEVFQTPGAESFLDM